MGSAISFPIPREEYHRKEAYAYDQMKDNEKQYRIRGIIAPRSASIAFHGSFNPWRVDCTIMLDGYDESYIPEDNRCGLYIVNFGEFCDKELARREKEEESIDLGDTIKQLKEDMGPMWTPVYKFQPKEKPMKKVLLKDIVIPKGTVLSRAPVKTVRHGDDHFDCVIGLSDNTSGSFTYCLDGDDLDEYFTDLKE